MPISSAVRRMLFSALIMAGTSGWLASGAHAQQAPNGGKDFDPATRLFSDKNPTIPDPTTPAPVQLTPEQQAELARQQQLAEIQQKREEAKKKAAAAQAAMKARQQAARDADMKRMAELKQMREERTKEMKDNREKLASLLQEQKDARKAYQDAKKTATGTSSQQIDDDYHKAEKDRAKQIAALRHPKYKPMVLPKDGTTQTTGTNTAGTSTALGGTTTSGTGPTATTH